MQPYRIVGLGEILWDVFPDGARFGGAPSNFACSAAELAGAAANVLVASAVGQDEFGQQALQALSDRGVDTSCVQINDRETGQVVVELDKQGVASYRFAENSAWDHLTWNEGLQITAANCDVVCFGTLGQRGTQSRNTIREFVRATSPDTIRILDINLRPPFDEDDLVLHSLPLANALKLNDDELPRVAKLCDLEGTETELLQALARRFEFRQVALTRGSRGAVIASPEEVCDVAGMEVEVVDTVGAGDAFTAAMALGLLQHWPLAQIAATAVETASYVCTQPGATMAMPSNLLKKFRG